MSENEQTDIAKLTSYGLGFPSGSAPIAVGLCLNSNNKSNDNNKMSDLVFCTIIITLVQTQDKRMLA